jgi:copper chaperone
MDLTIKKTTIVAVLIIVIGFISVTIAVSALTGKPDVQTASVTPPEYTAKVILGVSGMTCGGCEATIKKSLAGMDGVTSIDVNVADGKAEVTCDTRLVDDAGRIAEAITASGYPAVIERVVAPGQLQKEDAQAAVMARDYVAAVGDQLIPRQDYVMELSHVKNRYAELYGEDVFEDARGKQMLDALKRQTGQRLVEEEVQLNVIRRAEFTLDTAVQDKALTDFLEKKETTLAAFKESLEAIGYSFDYFVKRFNNRTLIQAYQDAVVFDGVSAEAEKRQQYLAWLGDARRQSSVQYFDKELARSGGGGCGRGTGSCCRPTK